MNNELTKTFSGLTTADIVAFAASDNLDDNHLAIAWPAASYSRSGKRGASR